MLIFGDELGVDGVTCGDSRYTGRTLILAVLLTRLMTSWGALPGTVTLIRSLPCCCTWAPELPVPFTRDSRTEIACCMAPGDGVPCVLAAFSTTWVPLDRSRPRPTLNWECHLLGLNVSLPVIEISMTRMSTARAAS